MGLCERGTQFRAENLGEGYKIWKQNLGRGSKKNLKDHFKPSTCPHATVNRSPFGGGTNILSHATYEGLQVIRVAWGRGGGGGLKVTDRQMD